MASKTLQVPSLSRTCGHEDDDRLLLPVAQTEDLILLSLAVVRDSDSDGFTSVTVSGSEDAMAKAEEMINDLTTDRGPPRHGGQRFGAETTDQEPSGEAPRQQINWGMILKDKEENDRKKFAGM
ncbi:hypothetical protein DPMN_081033 [Dreissena polymorpha]|uniref:Uncharacterized protein n=1 Tax=Dreissena polymorpha TaxID=45954 RepID=A0A9D3Y7B0_DREPO|nr:hypothetical protein DPMN_081033 [Dreissena polymorpha]